MTSDPVAELATLRRTLTDLADTADAALADDTRNRQIVLQSLIAAVRDASNPICQDAPPVTAAVDRMPGIRLVLDLSTAHLPADERDSLGGVDGVHAWRLRHGWLMWVPDDPDDSAGGEPDEVPGWVLRVQRYARRLGCDYAMFDRDAPVDPNLPTWPE